MINFIKKHTLLLAIIGAVAFLAVFLMFLFSKVGDNVYIVGVNGSVSIGTADDLHTLNVASVGMKLTKNDIIVTGNKSSCILSYDKNADEKDNFVNIGENSQVMLYDKNSQGGYKFFVTYGSVICNMPVDRSYRTNISTKLFNLFADGTITKVIYDTEMNIGKVYTFDGNPRIQTIQPSGTVNSAEKLLKNSVCAVSKLDDGTVGFGSLNVAFGLNEFTAQDLKTMSGVANIWSEKISYGSNEFEQAFQTASDYAKWVVTEPPVVELPSDTTYDETTETAFSDDVVTTVSNESEETTVVTPGYDTESEYEDSEDYTTTFDKERFDNEDATKSLTESLKVSIPYTVFTRQTVTETSDGEQIYETTAPVIDREDETFVPETTTRHRTTEKYVKETTGPSTETHTSFTTERSKPEGTTRHNVATAPSYTETRPAYTGTKPQTTTVPPTTTTAPIVTVNPNTVYTVIFTYNAGGKEFWSVQLVKHGKSAIAPDAPDIPGRKFIGWDKDFTYVTSDMTVTAVFDDSKNTKVSTAAKEYYTVNLYSEDKLWKTVTVKRGGTVNISGTPKSSNPSLVFCGWSDSLDNIQSDMTIFALFRSK